MDYLVTIINSFGIILTPSFILYLITGTMMGIFLGAVPGLSATLGIALLLPFTFRLDTLPALILAMGIYAGGMFGGCLSAITIHIPGTSTAAITMIDGYPMMQKGEGGRAIGHATIASAVGGMIGATMLIFFSPQVARIAINFRSPERFMLVLMALVVAASAGKGSLLKGIIATIFGMMIATVGIDVLLPISRFTFGYPLFIRGVGIIPMVSGLFAISELLLQIEKGEGKIEAVPWLKIRDIIPRWSEFKEIGLLLYIKSALIGVGIGALPGAGGTMASFVSYGEAKRSSRHPEKFGEGSVEGVIASEAANNAMCGGALVPLITLGIPGDSVTAVMFGVLLIQGLIPGPTLIIERADVIVPMFLALFLSKIVILIGIVLAPLYLRIVTLKKAFLYPFIGAIALVGVYVAEFSIFQVWLALIIGVFGYFLRKIDYPLVPLVMGYVLGQYFEQYLRITLSLSRGDYTAFVGSPICIILLVLTFVFFYFLRLKK